MYTYSRLEKDISSLRGAGVSTGSIGKSLCGSDLFFVHDGPCEGKQVIVTGGLHARENGSCALVMRQAFRFAEAELPVGFYFLPMLNPDGAILLEKGAEGLPNAEWLKKVNGGDDFSLWKANARAVDLNVNFPARWGMGKGNKFKPAPHGYIGAFPLSEPETRSLCAFTQKVEPAFTVSYHELGREVYWEFDGSDRRDRSIAAFIASYLSYTLVDGDLGSAGGYKDWCVTRGIPAVTIELGSDALTHPAFEEDIEEDIRLNLDLPLEIAKIIKNR